LVRWGDTGKSRRPAIEAEIKRWVSEGSVLDSQGSVDRWPNSSATGDEDVSGGKGG